MSELEGAEIKSLGRALSEERERQGLSRAEAAQRLHMSAYQVEALEIGDYSRLPQGTFLRGFVRNYSKILGLDPDAMLARLAQNAPPTPAPGIVVPSQNIRFDPLGERFASPYFKATIYAVVAVAFVLAGLYWWLFMRPANPGVASHRAAPAGQERGGPPQQIAAAPVAAPEPVAPAGAPVVSEPKPEAVPAAAPAKAPAEPSRPPAEPSPAAAEPKKAPARGERVIRLRFRGESWVEIRDGQGRVLLSRINPRGSEAEVTGRPPFSIIVGNAPDVDMTYDDRDFPLEPHTKVAVARFTVP